MPAAARSCAPGCEWGAYAPIGTGSPRLATVWQIRRRLALCRRGARAGGGPASQAPPRPPQGAEYADDVMLGESDPTGIVVQARASTHLPRHRLPCDLLAGARVGSWRIPAVLHNPVLLAIPRHPRDLCSLPAQSGPGDGHPAPAAHPVSSAAPGISLILPATYACEGAGYTIILGEGLRHARSTEAFVARHGRMREEAVRECVGAVLGLAGAAGQRVHESGEDSGSPGSAGGCSPGCGQQSEGSPSPPPDPADRRTATGGARADPGAADRIRETAERLIPRVPEYRPDLERAAREEYLRAAGEFERALAARGSLHCVPGFQIHLGFALRAHSPGATNLVLWLPSEPGSVAEACRAAGRCVEALEVALGRPVQVPQALADTPGMLNHLLGVMNPHVWRAD